MELILNEFVMILLLILVNGFFAGAELAVLSARKSRIASLAAAGNRQASIVEQIQKDPHRFLATVQIGVTVVGSLRLGRSAVRRPSSTSNPCSRPYPSRSSAMRRNPSPSPSLCWGYRTSSSSSANSHPRPSDCSTRTGSP